MPRRYSYVEPGDNGEHVVVTMSEDEILAEYYPYWCERMHRIGRLLLVSEEHCIDDFIVVHWATRVVPSCPDYRPDHNGECLNCDEPGSEHENG